MSVFSVQMEISGLAGDRVEPVEAIVDTGSTFSAVPREFLDRLGVRPARRQQFEIENGAVIENDVGDARVRLEGIEGITPVIFAEPGEPVLLGAVTLEAFLLGVDPIHERLVPLTGLRVAYREP